MAHWAVVVASLQGDGGHDSKAYGLGFAGWCCSLKGRGDCAFGCALVGYVSKAVSPRGSVVGCRALSGNSFLVGTSIAFHCRVSVGIARDYSVLAAKEPRGKNRSELAG